MMRSSVTLQHKLSVMDRATKYIATECWFKRPGQTSPFLESQCYYKLILVDYVYNRDGIKDFVTTNKKMTGIMIETESTPPFERLWFKVYGFGQVKLLGLPLNEPWARVVWKWFDEGASTSNGFIPSFTIFSLKQGKEGKLTKRQKNNEVAPILI